MENKCVLFTSQGPMGNYSTFGGYGSSRSSTCKCLGFCECSAPFKLKVGWLAWPSTIKMVVKITLTLKSSEPSPKGKGLWDTCSELLNLLQPDLVCCLKVYRHHLKSWGCCWRLGSSQRSNSPWNNVCVYPMSCELVSHFATKLCFIFVHHSTAECYAWCLAPFWTGRGAGNWAVDSVVY